MLPVEEADRPSETEAAAGQALGNLIPRVRRFGRFKQCEKQQTGEGDPFTSKRSSSATLAGSLGIRAGTNISGRVSASSSNPAATVQTTKPVRSARRPRGVRRPWWKVDLDTGRPESGRPKTPLAQDDARGQDSGWAGRHGRAGSGRGTVRSTKMRHCLLRQPPVLKK